MTVSPTTFTFSDISNLMTMFFVSFFQVSENISDLNTVLTYRYTNIPSQL